MVATVVNLKESPYEIYIGRPTKWGNPFSHLAQSQARYRVNTRYEAVIRYRDYLDEQLVSSKGAITIEDLARLHDHVLGCWCRPYLCHGDILVQYACWAYHQLATTSNRTVKAP